MGFDPASFFWAPTTDPPLYAEPEWEPEKEAVCGFALARATTQICEKKLHGI